MMLMLGDCLDRMTEIPDGSVDMVLADLPYGTTACKWDTVIPLEPLWAHYKRVTKPNAAIVLTASQPFTSALVMSNPRAFSQALIWRKNKASGHLNAKRRHLTAHEDTLIFCTGQPTYNPQRTSGHKRRTGWKRGPDTEVYGAQRPTEYAGTDETRCPISVIDFDVVNNDGTNGGRFHPTQKPVTLMEYLIRTYTNEGETVLDNTMGSGTTGVACVNTGRDFIGIEMDPDYYATAERRIAEAQKQGSLLGPPAARKHLTKNGGVRT
jgi:site-specific DNA-methyltransferase (adenine-specific)